MLSYSPRFGRQFRQITQVFVLGLLIHALHCLDKLRN